MNDRNTILNLAEKVRKMNESEIAEALDNLRLGFEVKMSIEVLGSRVEQYKGDKQLCRALGRKRLGDRLWVYAYLANIDELMNYSSIFSTS